ncbi:MAG: adenylate/guanylate cyclase domain-containing protein [Nitriliruptorales bacterium]|nr:adenylate/guanylate cyclase domain-containing protein [Nitriliruptorales bacterium]
MTDRSDPGEGPRRPRAEELTGEIPTFVADRIAKGAPDRDDEKVEDTVKALVDLGLDESDARAAVAERRVPLALASEVLGEPAKYSFEEVCQRAGLDPAVARRVMVAAGLPVPDEATEGDLEYGKRLAELLEHMPVEAIVRAARVRGSALASIARADLELIRDEIMLPMREAGADDLTVSLALAETARAVDPLSRELLVHEYHRQLLRVLDSELSTMLAMSEGQELEVSVGFVDLVGFTSLSAQVDPEGLDQVLEAFERRVVDEVGGHDRVAIVKYLGDAAMLVATDPQTLAETMLRLVEPHDSLEDAPLRGGLAHGATLVREGDYFGATVNLAARLTDLARPWTLLAAEDLVEDLSEPLRTKRIRPTRIRGIGLKRPLAVQWREPDDD